MTRSADARPPRRAAFARFGASAASVCLTLVMLGTMAAASSRWWLLGEIAVELRWQMAVGAAMACTFAWVGRRPRVAVAAAALFIVHAVPRVVETAGAFEPTEVPTARVMTANVWSGNPDPSLLAAWIDEDDADIVAVIELSHAWAEELPSLVPQLPYRVLEPRGSNFGIALLSRWPVEDVRVGEAANHPYVSALVQAPSGPVRVWVAHPMPPGSPSMIEERARYLEVLAAELGDGSAGPPRVVLGDLNATLYSWRLHALLDATGMETTRRGLRRAPTWPVGARWLGLDLDHVLVDRHLAPSALTVGPPVGGDHYPLSVTLARTGITPSR